MNAVWVGATVHLHEAVAAATTPRHKGSPVDRDGRNLSLSANSLVSG